MVGNEGSDSRKVASLHAGVVYETERDHDEYNPASLSPSAIGRTVGSRLEFLEFLDRARRLVEQAPHMRWRDQFVPPSTQEERWDSDCSDAVLGRPLLVEEKEERREEGEDVGDEERQGPEGVLDDEAVDLQRLDEHTSECARVRGENSRGRCCDSPNQSIRLLRCSARTGRYVSSPAQGARAQSRAQSANPGAGQSRSDYIYAIHQSVFAEPSTQDAPPLTETVSSI